MYHKMTIDETLKALDVNPADGLSDREVKERKSLKEPKSDNSSFVKFASGKVALPATYILLIAAIVSALFGRFYETVLMFVIVLFNLLFTAECRHRGKRLINSSVNASVTHAIVLRNGAKMKVNSDELVVGDIVTIKPGRVVPADLRLLSSEDLIIDESVIGNPGPVKKNFNAEIFSDVSASRRPNCAFSGTIVLNGRGDGVVIATGMSTELSRLAISMDKPKRDTLKTFSRLNKISGLATVVSAISAILVFVLGRLGGTDFLDTFLYALAFLVTVIPEGIFTAALVAMSTGASELRKNGFSAKNMQAVESLGEIKAFCTELPKLDIAATYTNRRRNIPEDEETIPFIHGLLLCEHRNQSLRAYAESKCDAKEVIREFPRIGVSSGKVATTLHRSEGITISYTAGDARDILERSSHIWSYGTIREISKFDKEDIYESINALEDEDFHLTAIGMRSGDELPCDTDLIFVGIAAQTAPDEASENPDTEKLSGAGVRPYLITESDAEKARLGAASLGISYEKMISGREIDSLSDYELEEITADTFVFFGMNASHKARAVKAIEGRGYAVAATGNRMSDTAALDAAAVGIADIHSKDVVKFAADVITDGSSSADCAVTLGKNARLNIKKAVMFLLSANLAEIICVLATAVVSMKLPFSPIQLLILNLTTDLLLPLAIASGSCGRLRFSKAYSAYISGILLGVASFAAFFTCRAVTKDFTAASGCMFVMLSLGELFLAMEMFCGDRSVFSGAFVRKPALLISVIFGILITFAVIYAPGFNTICGAKPIAVEWVGIACAVPAFILVVSELAFLIKRRFLNGRRNRA